MSITLREVAAQSSLSCETLLEALISPSSLEPEVVRHVMNRIKTSGYLDTFSRWKTGPRMGSVAVLSSLLDTASDVEAYKGIDRAMSALGLNTSMIAIPTRFSAAVRESALDSILGLSAIDAVITMNLNPDQSTIDRFASSGKTLVLMQTQAPRAVSVLLENQKGVSIGMNYLYGKGYRRIGFLNGPSAQGESSSVFSERLLGYMGALNRLGLQFDESIVREARSYDTDSGETAFAAFEQAGQLPQAVFCASGDMSAIGFIRAAKKRGLRIPEDIAVMGYDDLPVASLVEPGLTTVRQRLMIAGAAALVLALETCENGPGENLVIMSELVERESA